MEIRCGMTERSIPPGTVVSFIDPITQSPVKGTVKLELSEFVGVQYTGKNEPLEHGKPAHSLVTKDGQYFAWINISKEKVFVVR
jgi:hypothetical protein